MRKTKYPSILPSVWLRRLPNQFRRCCSALRQMLAVQRTGSRRATTNRFRNPFYCLVSSLTALFINQNGFHRPVEKLFHSYLGRRSALRNLIRFHGWGSFASRIAYKCPTSVNFRLPRSKARNCRRECHDSDYSSSTRMVFGLYAFERSN